MFEVVRGAGGESRAGEAFATERPGYQLPMPPDLVHLAFSVPAAVAGHGGADRARLLLMLDAVRSDRIPWRHGATVLGLAPSAFLDLARDHGVPVVHVDAGDLQADFATLDRLTRAL